MHIFLKFRFGFVG